MTPKLFQYQTNALAREHPQHIVLPEGGDHRVIAAASELLSRGLCKLTILGDRGVIEGVAKEVCPLSMCLGAIVVSHARERRLWRARSPREQACPLLP